MALDTSKKKCSCCLGPCNVGGGALGVPKTRIAGGIKINKDMSPQTPTGHDKTGLKKTDCKNRLVQTARHPSRLTHKRGRIPCHTVMVFHRRGADLGLSRSSAKGGETPSNFVTPGSSG